jgi:hypothetical protein
VKHCPLWNATTKYTKTTANTGRSIVRVSKNQVILVKTRTCL